MRAWFTLGFHAVSAETLQRGKRLRRAVAACGLGPEDEEDDAVANVLAVLAAHLPGAAAAFKFAARCALDVYDLLKRYSASVASEDERCLCTFAISGLRDCFMPLPALEPMLDDVDLVKSVRADFAERISALYRVQQTRDPRAKRVLVLEAAMQEVHRALYLKVDPGSTVLFSSGPSSADRRSVKVYLFEMYQHYRAVYERVHAFQPYLRDEVRFFAYVENLLRLLRVATFKCGTTVYCVEDDNGIPPESHEPQDDEEYPELAAEDSVCSIPSVADAGSTTSSGNSSESLMAELCSELSSTMYASSAAGSTPVYSFSAASERSSARSLQLSIQAMCLKDLAAAASSSPSPAAKRWAKARCS